MQVTCRYCGQLGDEDGETDLMPGVCPACFDARVKVAFFGDPMPRTPDELVDRLIEAGCHPERIRKHILGLIRSSRLN